MQSLNMSLRHIACVASLSVGFTTLESQFPNFGCARNGTRANHRCKRGGEGCREEGNVSFPSSPPLLHLCFALAPLLANPTSHSLEAGDTWRGSKKMIGLISRAYG